MYVKKEHIAESRIPGFNLIRQSKTTARKISWAVIVLVLVSLTLKDLYEIIRDYLSYPVIVTISLSSTFETEFPSVTLCNANPMRKNVICSPGSHEFPEYLAKLICSKDSERPNTLNATNENVNGMAHNVILRDNVSVWLAGLQRRDKFTAFRIGHQLEDFLVQCIFEGKSCSSIKYFARKGNALYGNCYVFNSRAFPTNYSKEIKRITRHSGPRHVFMDVCLQLHIRKTTFHVLRNCISDQEFAQLLVGKGYSSLELILYVEPNEYMPIIKEQGAYVMVHSPDAEGSHMNSMYVRSGESTYIGLKTTHIDRKPYPYPDKCRNNWPEWFEDMNSKSTVSYTREGCLQRCSQKKIVENCGCELAWMPSCNPGRNYTICDFYGNDEVNNCIHRTKFEGIDCSCTPRCHESVLEMSSSATNWPITNKYFQVTGEVEGAKNRFNDSTGLLRIVVYYNTFNYEEIRQEPKYTFSRLVSNIGGTLGLYTGLSFLAGMEILGQILKIFKNSLHKIRKKNITPVDQLEV